MEWTIPCLDGLKIVSGQKLVQLCERLRDGLPVASAGFSAMMGRDSKAINRFNDMAARQKRPPGGALHTLAC